MSPNLEWPQILLRLLLTLIAGGLVGLNRAERNRPAGLRTNLLVCLAASVSMILANLLLDTRGKASDSFVNFDVMRLPLGILTGMGFIGASAVIRRDNLVVGVTTAAGLWFVTVMGLCFGAGFFGLGFASLAVAIFVLWGLKRAEENWSRQRRATLTLELTGEGPSQSEITADLVAAQCKIRSWSVTYGSEGRELRCELEWFTSPENPSPPAFLADLARHPGVVKLDWR